MQTTGPTLSCPSCAGPVPLLSRFVLVAFCGYCGQTLAVTRDGLDPLGKTTPLADVWPVTRVGARGRLNGASFQVAGRLRFAYPDGYWDEWYLLFEDGSDAWLHEDEGELALVRRAPLPGAPPPIASIRVGATTRIGELSVFVTEKNRARVEGGEGQLPLGLVPGVELDYVDGSSGTRTIMLEYAPGGVELCLGEAVERDDIELEEPVG